VFLDEPFGYDLSIGVIGIGIHLTLDGFNLFRSNVRNHGQGFLGYGNEPCLGGDLDGVRCGSRSNGS
jgi:hypothetical protein